MLICSYILYVRKAPVGIDLRVTYPVNLIEIIGLHNHGADDASTVGGSELDINATEEDIEFTLDGGGISLLGDGEFRAERSALNGARGDIPLAEGR